MAKEINGTLHFLETGQLVTDWGEGHFLALKFTNNDPDKIKTIKVGLDPSQGSGLVPLDEDMNGVFKITDATSQKFIVEGYDENNEVILHDEYDLSHLVCEPKPEATLHLDEICKNIEILSELDLVNMSGTYTPTNLPINKFTISGDNFTTVEIDTFTASDGSFIFTFEGAPYTRTDNGTYNLTLTAYNSSDEVLASDTLNLTINIPESFIFDSSSIEENAEYAKSYFVSAKSFTVETLISGDVVSLDFNDETSPAIVLSGSLDTETGIYSGTISGVNTQYKDYNIDIKVNDTIVCSFVLDGNRDITLDEDTIEIGIGESETVLWNPVNFGANAVFTINGSDSVASAVLDTTNHTLVITGLSAGLATIGLSGWNNGDTTGTPDVHVTVDVTVKTTSVTFDDMYVTIDDISQSPYTEGFTVTNRPSGSTLSVVSSDTSVFTVDGTNLESGSFDITQVADGNGTATLSVIYGGETIASAVLPVAITIVPDGKTVTPTDDVQTLLKCAGIFDKSYTTINEVLADATTLAEITISNNAVDYLVRSTTFASAVTADQTAMTDIGADNYAADTLLADSTWLNAIYGSSYSSSVLNSIVPQMTSNTTPSGVVTVSSTYSGTWKSYGAFNDSYEWYGTNNNNQFVQYEFPEAMTLKAFEYAPSTNSGYAAAGYTITLTGSNDGTNFTQLATHSGITSRYEYGLPLNETAYKYYKMHILCENPGQYSICPNAHKIQYYGRKDV